MCGSKSISHNFPRPVCVFMLGKYFLAIHLLICWYYRERAHAIRYFQDVEETSHDIPGKL